MRRAACWVLSAALRDEAAAAAGAGSLLSKVLPRDLRLPLTNDLNPSPDLFFDNFSKIGLPAAVWRSGLSDLVKTSTAEVFGYAQRRYLIFGCRLETSQIFACTCR